jgi:MoaA/NifB/PqqE/SkfB family radical SAM enzyme
MPINSVLPYIVEIHLADHCNLNCKGCSHFAPLVSGGVYIDFENFKRDLIRLRQIFHDVYEIRLMGGEPLLNPEINRFLPFTRQLFPKAKISISTNGVLLNKMPDAFWQTCGSSNIYIKITNYPIHVDFKRIKQIGKTNEVGVKIPKKVNAFFQFMNINGDSNEERSFQTCRAMYTTPFLRDGKLYSCSFAPHVHIFNNYFKKEIPVSERDSINILDPVSPAEIFDFLNHPIPLCKWCQEKRSYMAWGKSQKNINEWISGETKDISYFLDAQKHRAISAYHYFKQTSEMKKRDYHGS